MAAGQRVPVYNPEEAACTVVGIASYAEMYLMPDILLLLVVNCGNMSPIVLKKSSSGEFEVQNVVQPDFLSFAAFTAYNQKFLMVTAE